MELDPAELETPQQMGSNLRNKSEGLGFQNNEILKHALWATWGYYNSLDEYYPETEEPSDEED